MTGQERTGLNARLRPRRRFYIAVFVLAHTVIGLLAVWGLYATDNAQRGVASAAPAPSHPMVSSFPSPRPTATPTVSAPLLSSLPFVPVVTTIEPSPGGTTLVAIPGSQGNVSIPNDVAGGTPLQVQVKPGSVPANAPAGLTVLRALEISFTNLADSTSVKELSSDVTIEISYAGMQLDADQLDRLVVYNVSRDEYLPTTIDAVRLMAIAHTRRFSTFMLSKITGPIPRNYLPLTERVLTEGW